MQIIEDIYSCVPQLSATSIVLGRFDGVHVGHKALIEKAVLHARSNNLIPVAFSFRDITYRNHFAELITTEEEKIALISNLGIAVLLHPTFEPPLIHTEAEDFIEDFLIEKWNARYIVVGYDFRFGKDRRGTSAMLKEYAEKRGATVEILEPVKVDGEPVKSTTIRALLKDGNLPKANLLLGRAFSLNVSQIPGSHIGTRLGFPTLNFQWPPRKVKLPIGVYAVKISCEALPTPLKAVADYGFRPTVEKGRTSPLLEVHVFDASTPSDFFASSVHHETTFKVEFYQFIREEKIFESLEALRNQIASDISRAASILQNPK